MCGINGLISKTDLHRELIEQMNNQITYRGPDDSTSCTHHIDVDTTAEMGMVRLAIIDLAGGTQPMTSNCGTFTLTVNGEIYNYPKLREKCASAGYQFRLIVTPKSFWHYSHSMELKASLFSTACTQ